MIVKLFILGCVCLLQLASCWKIKNETQVAQICRLKLYSPENGRIDELQEETPGEFAATFKCNPGYRMIGNEKISCKNGHWGGRVPWCKSLCNFVKCNDGEKCIVDEERANTRCICKNIYECPFEYKPVCGSDHVTYASKCIMGMAACGKKNEVELLSEGPCPKGLFQDAACSECPNIRICPALYASQYAFLGKLMKLNDTKEGIYLTFQVTETFKTGIESDKKTVTLFKRRTNSECSCVPFVPTGRAYIFGQVGEGPNGQKMYLFDETTFVEKFYGHKQMSMCWMV